MRTSVLLGVGAALSLLLLGCSADGFLGEIENGVAKSGDAYLTALLYESTYSPLSKGAVPTLSPPFESTTFAYTVAEGGTPTTLTITATTSHAGATLTINGQPAVSGVGLTFAFTPVITIVVTAEDGVTQQTYTITVSMPG